MTHRHFYMILPPPGFVFSDNARYVFDVPNFVDEMPIKYLRIQLTWEGTTAPPLGVDSTGFEGSTPVSGLVTFASTPLVFTQPDGGYQYFDLEYIPNPDYETITVQVADGAQLVQVVIDSVSVPEPATIGLLAFGTLAMLRKRI
jgi:hypothetical protein